MEDAGEFGLDAPAGAADDGEASQNELGADCDLPPGASDADDEGLDGIEEFLEFAEHVLDSPHDSAADNSMASGSSSDTVSDASGDIPTTPSPPDSPDEAFEGPRAQLKRSKCKRC